MYCGDRQGSLLIRVCHLSKITFMFCNVLWGQTGESFLIRVCHLSKITFMFCHVLWGQTGGHSSLWSVICQKSHLCFVMYCGDRRGESLLIRVCHLSKITFMFCNVLWGQTGGHSSLGCVICQKSHLCFVMYCGDRRGCHSSLWSVICQKSHLCFVMYCGDRQGVTPHYGVSFVKNHIYVLSCIVGTDGGSHSSLGCVICQKSHLCFVMYCGDRQGVTPH